MVKPFYAAIDMEGNIAATFPDDSTAEYLQELMGLHNRNYSLRLVKVKVVEIEEMHGYGTKKETNSRLY